MTNIDQLYDLITNSTDKDKTYTENLELWKKFSKDIGEISEDDISNPKLYFVINFMLEQGKTEIPPEWLENIMSKLIDAQTQLIRKTPSIEIHPQDLIAHLSSNLLRIEEVLGKVVAEAPNIPSASKIKSKSELIKLETILKIIDILYQKFFELEPEFVNELLDSITQDIIELVKSGNATEALYTEYLEKILPIKKFAGYSLQDDELIKDLKNHQLKDEKLITLIFTKLPIQRVLELFDYKLTEILDFLDKVDYISSMDKQRFASSVFDEMSKKNYYSDLLSLIVTNNQSSLWRNYLTQSRYNQIIFGSMQNSVVYLSDDMIKFLLVFIKKNKIRKIDKKYLKIIKLFLSQVHYLIKKEDFLEEDFDIIGIKKLLSQVDSSKGKDLDFEINQYDNLENKRLKTDMTFSKGLDIDFKIAIELLREYFKKKIILTEFTVMAIIRSIATYFLEELGIENNGMYWIEENNANLGKYDIDLHFIEMNGIGITDFLNKKLPLCQRLGIYITKFHELSHAIVDNDIRNKVWNINTYEVLKQNIMREYDSEFYNDNYGNILDEIIARINGIDILMKFLEAYLPEILDLIQAEVIEDLEKEKSMLSSPSCQRTMSFLNGVEARFHQGFDALVRYNSQTILTSNPILLLEYREDGTPKTYDEICQGRTEENGELIDKILRNRYPESMTGLINSSHHGR